MGAGGFTIVELLVTISIIAVLASLLLPALAIAKKKARVAQARTEMANLVAAIQAYEAEYQRPPAVTQIESGSTDAIPDFTYGTVKANGSAVLGPNGQALPPIRTGGAFEADNSFLMAILMARDTGANQPNPNNTRNPRRHVFFNAKESMQIGDPGLNSDLVLRDPWGNPYIVTIDLNDDSRCRHGSFNPDPSGNPEVAAPVAVWSFGPDGKPGDLKDNVLSWK